MYTFRKVRTSPKRPDGQYALGMEMYASTSRDR